MPLLNKRPFVKNPNPEDLRDDEEIFHCVATDEVFRDYEDFSERMFLCNSMVWTCAFTGKSNLTYAEALESEENAKNTLKEFPSELKVPLLFLAMKTKRKGFGDMVEDIFMYVKDRYFIGENVETCFTTSKWKDSHILHVLETKKVKSPVKNGGINQGTQYKYEIEHLDKIDQDVSEIMIVDYSQIRRKKGTFSREKCKLFLKQHLEQDSEGFLVIKPKAVEDFDLNNITFENIFVGAEPHFAESKKTQKAVNGKRVRQESLHKYLTKTNYVNNNVIPQVKKNEQEIKSKKQQEKEKKNEIKQKIKQDNILFAKCVKNWYKPKEDLELVDHQVLPQPTPVKMKVPEDNLGDMFMVLEFVKSFSELLSVKSFFPGGLTLELIERALTQNEVAGPLIDIIQMFLVALFRVQEEEASQYLTETVELWGRKQEDDPDDMDIHEASRRATIAAKWSKCFQGFPMNKLALNPVTTSEILRLHLLASGSIIKCSGARWRYSQRGGYVSEDDPGLHLKMHDADILNALKTQSVVEFSITDKLKILSCLINQLLTYADIRDVVEERVDKIKQARADRKALATAEKKRHHEFLAARFKLKKELKANPCNASVAAELQKLVSDLENSKEDDVIKMESWRKESYKNQVVLGYDRCFQQYLKLESVPGLLINAEEEKTGSCFNNIIEQNSKLITATREETMNYIKKTMQDQHSNNKENNQLKSPKKTNNTSDVPHEEKLKRCQELRLCTADPATCVIHSVENRKEKWFFYSESEKIEELTNTLNKRGIRENELQDNINSNIEKVEKLVNKTPVHTLNYNFEAPEVAKKGKPCYDNANFGFDDMKPPDILHNLLVENILEMEEKLHSGGLGILKVEDRQAWRECLENKNYKDLDKTLVVRSEEEEEEKKVLEVFSEVHQPMNTEVESKVNGCNGDVEKESSMQEAVQTLARALAQLGQSVVKGVLKKPLGNMRNNDIKISKRLVRWERSLLASTNFSQIFLHYSSLDSCVMWKRANWMSRCKICRCKGDSDKMLLCDVCNQPQHTYCSKPKLKSVPEGDWFCDKCQKERKPEVPKRQPPKRRPIFTDEEEDEEENDEKSESSEEYDDVKVNGDADQNGIQQIKVDLCKTCGSGGEVIYCDKCPSCFHIECVEPPLRRPPRGPWLCTSCKSSSERKRSHDLRKVNGAVIQRTGKVNGQRRCAAQALFKIHDFAKSLRHHSESDGSSDEEIINKRNTRRDDNRSDLPLHNSALHAVLSDIMKDCNAWPFLRPVQKTEVPDYYDVIEKPMDFGTIKYKLNMGEYKLDADFMVDALLIFENCNTYNHSEDDVYKCGVALLARFQQKCKEMGLKLPEELDDEPLPRKKIRTK